MPPNPENFNPWAAMPFHFWSVVYFVFGTIVGSFLNVCIYRWTREDEDLSVISPRSFCVSCRKPIVWYDNVPLLSYLLLRGRCRQCLEPISLRYPVVEALTAFAFLGFVFWHGPTLVALKYCLFSALLIALVFADLEARILPDELTLGGTLAGIVLAGVVPVDDAVAETLLALLGLEPGPRLASIAEAALGAALPPVFLWLGGFLYEKIRGREGLGFGDVKMLAMIGAFLGLRESLWTLIVGSLAGSILGLLYILITRRDPSTYELPFGTFLGAAALGVAAYASA